MRTTPACGGVITALGLLALALTAGADTASITIDAGQPGPRLNPRMYGIFLEEINHGVDGGLYAELIRNRGFEDAKPPEGFTLRNGRWMAGNYDAGFGRFGYFTNGLPFWSLVREGGAEGSMNLETNLPLNAATPRSCRLEIGKVAGGRLGIANGGFWGIGVTEGGKFNLSFWARCTDGFAGPLTATLENVDGSVCAGPVEIRGVSNAWQQFNCSLVAIKSEPKARFVLSAGSPGTVWFDMVSLFPADTFKQRPNGLRRDLAEMLAALKPGFVRFPGGCVVEGGTVETAFDWKKSVGPLEAREEQWGPWNYRETHGMGFLEYLQFCEDIGSEPLYVGFCGETCFFRHLSDVPMDQMGWVATNFLDAVEFANGGASTPWGAARAKAGHATPFNLKLIEVGNEGHSRNFPPRYKLVHSLLKEKFSDLSYINDLSFQRRDWVAGEGSDLEDNHFYNSPQWFMNNTHLYDSRDRKLPPVYDGEVAVTSGEGGPLKGNLVAALGEGAFLMGLERNADVVKMVSYAPLLANVRGRTDWHGMIYFDPTRAFGTASYYLWRLFSENRPDYTLQTSVELQTDEPAAISGGIGVGTWEGSAEFKNIHIVSGDAVEFAPDFSQGGAGWSSEGGTWSMVAGAWRQSDDVVGLSYLDKFQCSDCVLTLKARKLHGPEGFLIVFGHKGGDKYWWNIGGWGNREHAIEFNQTSIGEHVPGTVEANRWYDIKVEITGRHIRCFLDGQLIHDVMAPSSDHFFAVAGRDEARGELVLKAINTSARPVAANLKILGVGVVGPDEAVTVLKSENLQDNNSLEQPEKIAPAKSQGSNAATQFSQEFAPQSLTVMRVKIK